MSTPRFKLSYLDPDSHLAKTLQDAKQFIQLSQKSLDLSNQMMGLDLDDSPQARRARKGPALSTSGPFTVESSPDTSFSDSDDDRSPTEEEREEMRAFFAKPQPTGPRMSLPELKNQLDKMNSSMRNASEVTPQMVQMMAMANASFGLMEMMSVGADAEREARAKAAAEASGKVGPAVADGDLTVDAVAAAEATSGAVEGDDASAADVAVDAAAVEKVNEVAAAAE